MIDSHCHLADAVFAPDLEDVISRAKQAGLTSALCILSADEPEELAAAERMRALWPEVRFAAGVHPHRASAGEARGATLERVAWTTQAVERMSACAIGEIGLDYHYDFAPKAIQHAVFAAQVELAVSIGAPVVIHTREAMADTAAILREAGGGKVRGVMHCFTGTVEDARLSLDLGFHISLAGIVTFPKAGALRDVAKLVPDDRLLVETDAPFLAPVPHRGKRNEPAYVVETCKVVAALRSQTSEEVAAIVSRNFDALFRVFPAKH